MGSRYSLPRFLYARNCPYFWPDLSFRRLFMGALAGLVATVPMSISIRPYVLRECIQACRKGGVVSLAGVYGGFVDSIPMGAAFNRGLTLKMGQTHVHRYLKPLFEMIENGQIDPSFVVTHTLPLAEAPQAYEMFKKKEEGCIKVVLKPSQQSNRKSSAEA